MRRARDGIGHLAGDRDEPGAGGVVIELAGEERARVRMARSAEDFIDRTGLDDRAAVHDTEVVAELRDEAEMVRDEDDRAREAAAQVLEQRDDLCFDRRIERCRRLVGEQQVGLDQQRHGDHHTLAHAARELVRIGRQAKRSVRDADARKRRDGALQGCVSPDSGLAPAQHVDEVRADGEQRIQRRHRILEDHGDARAAVGVHRGLVEREEIDAVEHDPAADAGQVRRQQPDEAGGQARLAGARFTDDAEDAVPADVEVDAAQDVRRAPRRRGLERQVPDRHQRSCG